MENESNNIRFMIVDDEEDVLDVLTVYLEQAFENCSVTKMTSPKKALDMLQSGIIPTVIITDHSMPEMSGVAFAKEIMRNRFNTIVVLYSGYVDLLDTNDGVDLCFQGILEKPSSLDEIKRTLSEILAIDDSIDRQYVEYKLERLHNKTKAPFNIYVHFGNQYIPLFKASMPVDPLKVQKIIEKPEVKCFIRTEDYIRYSDSSYKSYPVNLIIPGVVLPFSIYLKLNDAYKRIIPVGVVPKKEHFEIFQRHQIGSFFLDDAEEYHLHSYIESNLDNLLKSKNIIDSEKGRILFERGYYLLKRVISSVNGGNIRSLKKLCTLIEEIYKHSPNVLYYSLENDKVHDLAKHSYNVALLNFLIYNQIMKMKSIPKYANEVKSFEKNVFAGKDVNIILLLSGFLHDVGMSKYIRFFQKNVEEMSEEDLKFYFEHVDVGINRLRGETDVPQKVLEVIGHHEEFCDGSGHLKLLKNKLPIMSQIISLTNYFDLKIKNGLRRRDAIVEIQMAADKFNQSLVGILRRVILPDDVK